MWPMHSADYLTDTTAPTGDKQTMPQMEVASAASAVSIQVAIPGTSAQGLKSDQYFKPIIMFLTQGPIVTGITSQRVIYRSQRFVWDTNKNTLYLKQHSGAGDDHLRQCVVGGQNRRKLWLKHHETRTGGHHEAERTMDEMGRHFYWPNMARYIHFWTTQCSACQCVKPQPHKQGVQPPQPLAIPNQPGEVISVDFVQLPLSTSGNDYLLVTVDKFSKMVKVAPCAKEITAQQTAELFLNITLPLYAHLPVAIVSDRDVRFTSKLWQELWALLDCKLHMNTAYRPQGDGQTERANRQILEYLRNVGNTP